MDNQYSFYQSPVGNILLKSGNEMITGLSFCGSSSIQTQSDCLAIKEVELELDNYFKGRLSFFSVPCALPGTEFQIAVLNQAKAVPYGETVSYAELAESLGDRSKARAVGRALATNPILLIYPCHRVIGANGAMTGFAAGMEIKQALIAMEKEFRQERQCEP
ncbi:MAG: methylated-DNA--[protein]-cysteine S-methyltransferase [bacterium]|nr:methylated-DNA--[protein]-cysteine S-methyltransferase [bacterium]